MADFYAMAQDAANKVEALFGEQVDLLPWEGERQTGGFAEGGPDNTRTPQMNVRVIFKEWDNKQTSAGEQLNSQIATATAYFNMRQTLVDACGLRQHDRIHSLKPERNNAIWEVLFVAKSSVGRPRVYVVEVPEAE